jgi:GNAT superfamily N-acetyltransferase
MTEQATIEIMSTRLRDGRAVVIRQLDRADRAALVAFGHALSHVDRMYVPDDFESPEVVRRLIDACTAEHWRQFVASAGDLIAAYGAVLLRPGRSSHVATLHLIVSSGWRHSGLAGAMVPALPEAARTMGATHVNVELLEEQIAGRALFERLGFQLEAVLQAHVQGRDGRPHTLLVMARDLI